MKTFVVRASFTDRKQGPGTGRTLEIEASTLPGALAKAAREFWKQLGRKERFDCNTSGLTLVAREREKAIAEN